ncbi:hypothetical protein [Sphaerotilus microaerophilus]|uniref:DUF4878 domain-containing protein n=1 Tax=Sphaerotilus microaerophilus TaxID=2914710 RepID=A0ABN6PS78_9BURK|nr:hypothetical protein [Sphaerotilus sp. FB-5]BDI07493.1 hypothetical protein CATMQ487_44630 [Sphaerotilus sp. FB-5]
MRLHRSISQLPRRAGIATAAVFTVLLSACSDAPSEGDIRGALERLQKAESAAMPGMLKGMLPNVELTNVKKLGCEASGEKAFRCDVEVTVKAMGRVATNSTQLRLVRGSEGWMVSR